MFLHRRRPRTLASNVRRVLGRHALYASVFRVVEKCETSSHSYGLSELTLMYHLTDQK